jgi:Actin like proteins N terminal domain
MSTDQTTSPHAELSIFSIDVGYGHVKATYSTYDGNAELFSFPSIVLAVEDFPHTQWIPKPLDLVKTGVTRQFLTGEDLFLIQSPNLVTPTHDDEFCRKPLYKQLVAAALHRQPYNKINKLVLALPLLTFMKHKLALAEQIKGDYVLSSGRTVYVHSVAISVQGVAAVQKAVDPSVTPFVIGIDLGSHTLDVVSVIDGSIAPDKCKSLANGMNNLVGEIIGRLTNEEDVEYGKSAMNTIRQVLVTNKPSRFGAKIFNRAALLALAPRYVESLRYTVELYIENDAKIALLGGGAGVLKEVMRKHKDRFLQIDHPEYANALGMKTGL